MFVIKTVVWDDDDGGGYSYTLGGKMICPQHVYGGSTDDS